jgi:class 3 adenylate cyclase/pimeloyl-ACP methyl ester carboxylesterase
MAVSIEPQIRYARTGDGVSIAFWTLGEGRPFFMNSPLTFSHCGLEVRIPRIAELYERIATKAMLVRWDLRNYGMSQRGVERLGLEDNASDVVAVADALDVDQFDFIGLNNYPTVAALRPDRVRRVVLVGPPPMRLAELLDEPDQAAVRSLASTNWDVFTETHGSFLQGWHPDPSISYAQFIRASVDQADYLRIMQAWREWDFTDYLERITAPTLIVSASDTSPRYRDASRIYAAAIVESRLVEVDGFVAQQAPETYALVESFLEDRPRPSPRVERRSAAGSGSAARFRTVLFTDIVDHTAMMQRLGDAKGRDVLREHERITREVLRKHDGAEVKTMGDGFLASFESVTDAVMCAIALQQAFAARRPGDAAMSLVEPIEIRIGMNAGEPIEEDDDLFGSTVILASRIAATADGGEILVPEAVRHLLAGKAFSFADRGAVALKGFDDPVRLFEVRWQELGR